MIKLKEGQKVVDEDGNIYEIEKGDTLQEAMSKDFEKDVLRRPSEFRYQMLSRLVQDAEYYLNAGGKHPKHLWSGDAIDHADNMLALYNSFSKNEKPEWLTFKELENYIKELYASV